MIARVNQDITSVVSSTVARPDWYEYTQVLVCGTGSYSVIFNGLPLTLTGPLTFNLKINSIEQSNPNIFLLGHPRIGVEIGELEQPEPIDPGGIPNGAVRMLLLGDSNVLASDAASSTSIITELSNRGFTDVQITQRRLYTSTSPDLVYNGYELTGDTFNYNVVWIFTNGSDVGAQPLPAALNNYVRKSEGGLIQSTFMWSLRPANDTNNLTKFNFGAFSGWQDLGGQTTVGNETLDIVLDHPVFSGLTTGSPLGTVSTKNVNGVSTANLTSGATEYAYFSGTTRPLFSALTSFNTRIACVNMSSLWANNAFGFIPSGPLRRRFIANCILWAAKLLDPPS